MWLFFDRTILVLLCLILAQACGDDQGTGTDTETGGDADTDVDTDADTDGDTDVACSSGTVVFQSDFEDQTLDGMWVDGDATITDEQVYLGDYSVVYRFTGSGHFGLTNMAPYREFYVEFWAYLDDMPCVSSCDSAGKHFFRFAWWPNKSGGIQKQIDTGMINGQLNAYWFSFEPETVGGNVSYGSAVQPGTWQRIRVAYRANTTGSADGRFIWMYGDTVLFDLTDEFFGAADELDTFIFTNYDFEPGDGITNPRIFIDNLEVRTGPGSYDCLDAS